MKSELYQHILKKTTKNQKLLAVLLDPDKCKNSVLESTLLQFRQTLPDIILIGGSSQFCPPGNLLDTLQEFKVPKVLFPGDASQFSEKADGMLYLSLISGRNPDYLIGQHVKSALEIRNSGIEIIPTGYILIDGGTHSAVCKISKTTPISANDIQTATATAVAGELLGMKMIYLEAGSGAKNPVSAEMISTVKSKLTIPLIVGGGIKCKSQLQTAYNAGADLVVVGNVFETNSEKISEFIEFVRSI